MLSEVDVRMSGSLLVVDDDPACAESMSSARNHHLLAAGLLKGIPRFAVEERKNPQSKSSDFSFRHAKPHSYAGRSRGRVFTIEKPKHILCS